MTARRPCYQIAESAVRRYVRLRKQAQASHGPVCCQARHGLVPLALRYNPETDAIDGLQALTITTPLTVSGEQPYGVGG